VKGKTIQEVYATDKSYIEDFIIEGHIKGRHTLLTDYPALADALRTLPEESVDREPSLERALNSSTDDRPSILQYEGWTESGNMKMNERSSEHRF
jgi:hypothetical protein